MIYITIGIPLAWLLYCANVKRPPFPVGVSELHEHERDKAAHRAAYDEALPAAAYPWEARRTADRAVPETGTARVNGVAVVWSWDPNPWSREYGYRCWRLDGRPTGKWAGWGINRVVRSRSETANNNQEVAKILEQGKQE